MQTHSPIYMLQNSRTYEYSQNIRGPCFDLISTYMLEPVPKTIDRYLTKYFAFTIYMQYYMQTLNSPLCFVYLPTCQTSFTHTQWKQQLKSGMEIRTTATIEMDMGYLKFGFRASSFIAMKKPFSPLLHFFLAKFLCGYCQKSNLQYPNHHFYTLPTNKMHLIRLFSSYRTACTEFGRKTRIKLMLATGSPSHSCVRFFYYIHSLNQKFVIIFEMTCHQYE